MRNALVPSIVTLLLCAAAPLPAQAPCDIWKPGMAQPDLSKGKPAQPRAEYEAQLSKLADVNRRIASYDQRIAAQNAVYGAELAKDRPDTMVIKGAQAIMNAAAEERRQAQADLEILENDPLTGEARNNVTETVLWANYEAEQAMQRELDAVRAELEAVRKRYNDERKKLLSGSRDAASQQAANALKAETLAALEGLRTRLLRHSCWTPATTFVANELDHRIAQVQPGPVPAADPVFAPEGPLSVALTGGGCTGTLSVNTLSGRKDEQLVFTFRAEPPGSHVIERVVMTSKEACTDLATAQPTACDATRTGTGAYRGIFKRLSRFVGRPGNFTVEFTAFAANGQEVCKATTPTLTTLP
jgi:hypothetical protein